MSLACPNLCGMSLCSFNKESLHACRSHTRLSGGMGSKHQTKESLYACRESGREARIDTLAWLVLEQFMVRIVVAVAICCGPRVHVSRKASCRKIFLAPIRLFLYLVGWWFRDGCKRTEILHFISFDFRFSFVAKSDWSVNLFTSRIPS